ncbi:MAG: ribonuclease E/G, partial [Clostridia bacterium]|nr:ribonuclease E/G [Clostridia bacterium]
MSRKFYFDNQYGTDIYALCEDGLLTEYTYEQSDNGAVIGNVYKGRVTDVLSGMQAAFVDCGLEKHCYLSASDTEGDFTGEALKNLKVGDEILVQVTRVPSGKKGAKVTKNISFVGKYLVYLPYSSFVGVSAKIDDDELRRNLIFNAKSHLNNGEGMIVRTAAPYAVLQDKLTEIEYFRKLIKNIETRFEYAPVGELLYSDSPLHMR